MLGRRFVAFRRCGCLRRGHVGKEKVERGRGGKRVEWSGKEKRNGTVRRYLSKRNAQPLNRHPSASPPMDARQCHICFKTFKQERFLLSHQRQFKYCHDALALLAATLNTQQDTFVGIDGFDETAPDPPHYDSDAEDELGRDLDELLDDLYVDLAPVPTAPVDPGHLTPPVDLPPPPTPPPRSLPLPAQSENIDRYSGAARVVREDAPVMTRWAQRHGHADNPYHPFKSKVDWEIGRWAKQEGPGATSLDRLLGFDSVCYVSRSFC